ncbi:uncharacterized protein LOC142224393 [Haematobia irritans]|uniref:uncharacterized protein LOC142224393 n=1 Tax=Haematobia irritans TaxID=7368 RepID=UPI003F50B080
MDRDRCKKQDPRGYLPDRSPNRSPRQRACDISPRHLPESPEVLRNVSTHLGNMSMYDIDDINLYDQDEYKQTSHIVDPHEEDLQERPQTAHNVRAFEINDFSEDILEDYVEPSFYEHDSFEEVMCAYGSPQVPQMQKSPVGTAAAVEEKRKPNEDGYKQKPLTPKKIEPLPDDPNIIPPHPKDPKDYAAMIRRARAIQRLKAMQEAEQQKEKKVKTKPTEKAKLGDQKMKTARKVPATQTTQVKRKAPPMEKPKKKGSTTAVEHPPDYIPPDYAAAILHARKVAGIKTRNPKLLPQLPQEAKPRPEPPKACPKSPVPQIVPPTATRTPTYEDIIKRAAGIRAKTYATDVGELKKPSISVDDQDQLEEFEVLEQLYDAQPSQQCTPLSIRENEIFDRIKNLEDQLLERSPQRALAYEAMELSPSVRYYDTMKRQEEMFIPGARTPTPPQIGKEVERNLSRTPPQAVCPTPPSQLKQTTRDWEMADINLDDINFDEMNLYVDIGDISMPSEDWDQPESLQEYDLEDITSPELDDLSISLPEALEPDYPIELSDEAIAPGDDEDQDKTPGFLTSVVSAVVDKFKNIFSGSPREENEAIDDERSFDLDSSLPNLFETTAPEKPKQLPSPKPSEKPIPHQDLGKVSGALSPIVIPPHPKDPKDYRAMVKRAQLIQKLKARELEAAKAEATPVAAEYRVRKKAEVKSTIPKRVPKKVVAKTKSKAEPVQKVYPPGEYSPSYVAAVARARALAGYKNRTALLNPELAAKIAALKAQKEAELAAEEALPPVERMRKRMARIQSKTGRPICVRPSIETLGTLEAIRENLPKPSVPYQPKTKRVSLPSGGKRSDTVFTKSYRRPMDQYKPMTPIAEEINVQDDLIDFSPLRPHEGKLRLKYLKELAERRQAEGQECPRTPILTESPRTPKSPQYTPITLESPKTPSRTKEVRKETVTTTYNEVGLQETIHEESTKLSQIQENGEVHTSAKKITTTTDEFGNVVEYHVEEKGTDSGQRELAILDEDIEGIEEPDFMDISDVSPQPKDSSIPTPAELIDKIRHQVQQKMQQILPQEPTVPKSPIFLRFPEDLPEEELSGVDMPEMPLSPQVRTPLSRSIQERSPNVSLPYCFGETAPLTPPPHPSPERPKSPLKPVEPIEEVAPTKIAESDSCPKPIVIPPHPKDPKDYVAMVKRAQAIEKLRKQREAEAAALAPPKSVAVKLEKDKRVALSKRPSLVLREQRKKIQKLKKKPSKPVQIAPEECPAEPPPIPPEYAAAVARARALAGYKNTTALLNPELAAKIAAQKAAEEAERAAFEQLPPYEKIMKRMEKLRGLVKKQPIQVSADVLGVIEAIRSTIPTVEEERKLTPVCPQKPKEKLSPEQINKSLQEFEAIEQKIAAAQGKSPAVCQPRSSLDKFEALDAQIMTEEKKSAIVCPARTSLEEFEDLEKQLMPDEMQDIGPVRTSLDEFEDLEKALMDEEEMTKRKPVFPTRSSLEEFEDLERQMDQIKHSREARSSLDEFEYLEKQMEIEEKGYETPRATAPGRRGRNLLQEIASAQPDEDKEEFHKKLIAEFEMVKRSPQDLKAKPIESLMPSTPESINERLRKIKEAQRRSSPRKEADIYAMDNTTQSPAYSPIILSSPSGKPYTKAVPKTTPISTIARDDDVLVDLHTPHQKVKRVKQFAELEDMPLEDLEYEDVPEFADISFDKPMSPPPQPSELIERIKIQVHKRLREVIPDHSIIQSPQILKFPEDIPEEELWEVTAPPFARTPQKSPSIKPQTPRVSLPSIWEEKPLPSPHATPKRQQSPAKTSQAASPPKMPEEIHSQLPKVPSSERPIVIPPHPKDPKDYRAMVKRAQAIQKLLLQKKEAEMAVAGSSAPVTSATVQVRGKERVPISKWVKPPPKQTKLRKKLVMKKKVPPEPKDQNEKHEDVECPLEPPPLPAEYVAAVARARLLAGYKNRTALLNPAIAAKIAQKKAAEEAEAAAYDALPEHEKLKIRLEKLKSKRGRSRRFKPTTEQMAFLQHLKEAYRPESPIPRTQFADSAYPQRLSLSPRATSDADESYLKELAEFERLENMEGIQPQSPIHPSEIGKALDMSQMIANLEQQLLDTPPPMKPEERYKQLLAQRQATPKTPQIPSPIKTPDVHYTPISFAVSPKSPDTKKRSIKTSTHMKKSGDSTIREEVTEKSEIINGDLEIVTKRVTTTTDSMGNVTTHTEENKQVQHLDSNDESMALENVEEPSFLDVTPVSPTGAPRPRDIIERIQKEVRSRQPKPDVPMGQLIELRTPPKQLPLPQDISVDEELYAMTCPALPATPISRTPPSRSPPISSPDKASPHDMSLPEVFVATPPPPTPPLPPVSPLRRRVPSPEGPIIIPPHPKDPNDYAAMVRRARKIQQFMAQQEAERAAAEAEAAAAAAAEEAKKKNQRLPLSRRGGKRPRLVLKKRKVLEPAAKVLECPKEPPPLPAEYIEQVARARELAGLKNLAPIFNPKLAEKEAAKEAATTKQEEAVSDQPPPLHPPQPLDYGSIMSRVEEMKAKGLKLKEGPPLAAAAYINAMKVGMEAALAPKTTTESPKTRYKRLLESAATVGTAPVVEDENMPDSSKTADFSYTPIMLESPQRHQMAEAWKFDSDRFKDLTAFEEIEGLEEPSLVDMSDLEKPTVQSSEIPSPRTPQPTPSRLIEKIREQVFEKMRTEKLISAPSPLQTAAPSPPPPMQSLPQDIDDEDLFEISAIDFPQTPKRAVSPIRSPNVSIPQYFDLPPSPKSPERRTPKAASPDRLKTPASGEEPEEHTSPPLLGVHPGLRVKTPQGTNVQIPPHPKDTKDYVAMIQRAQLIQKIKAKQEAKEMKKKQTKAVRVPETAKRKDNKLATTRRPLPSKTIKIPKKPKETPPPQVEEEHPAEPPQLPYDYVLAVARARRMAGLKTTADVLNPPKPPQDYATIMKRIQAMRAQVGQTEPTDEELEATKGFIKRPQLKERAKSEVKQSQEDKQVLKTPIPPQDRYRALRSRIPKDTPKTSHIPYSPPKTPQLDELQYDYSPILMPPSPRCPFLEDLSEQELGDISMPFELYEQYPHLSDDNISDISMPLELQSPQNIAMCPRTEVETTMVNKFSPLTGIELRTDSLDEFEALELQALEKMEQSKITSKPYSSVCVLPDDSLDEFEAFEKYTENISPKKALSRSIRAACALADDSLDEFEALERQMANMTQAESAPTRTPHRSTSPHGKLTSGGFSAVQSVEAHRGMSRIQHRR